jgi:hypothetical protein
MRPHSGTFPDQNSEEPEIIAQVSHPQGFTRSTWGPHRAWAGPAPGCHPPHLNGARHLEEQTAHRDWPDEPAPHRTVIATEPKRCRMKVGHKPKLCVVSGRCRKSISAATTCIQSWLPQQSKVQGRDSLGVSSDSSCLNFGLRHGQTTTTTMKSILPCTRPPLNTHASSLPRKP